MNSTGRSSLEPMAIAILTGAPTQHRLRDLTGIVRSISLAAI